MAMVVREGTGMWPRLGVLLCTGCQGSSPGTVCSAHFRGWKSLRPITQDGGSPRVREVLQLTGHRVPSVHQEGSRGMHGRCLSTAQAPLPAWKLITSSPPTSLTGPVSFPHPAHDFLALCNRKLLSVSSAESSTKILEDKSCSKTDCLSKDADQRAAVTLPPLRFAVALTCFGPGLRPQTGRPRTGRC